MHRGQAAEEGALPRALRSVATVAVAGLRVGHVTQRLQQQAPRGSEPRCLTLVMRDATCLSVVFADEGAMRRCRAATGLAALAAHAAGERERERKREVERGRESEPRCLTLVMRDATCLSVVFANPNQVALELNR
jgi:hypothetical protein